ncbi:hypothetical protein [Streptomyces sp. NPDC006510]|uniref:hypothetical protein n=1 Tax=Streptomyces sp. NPDC006510 TaxID=3155600 RepID=UPI0033B90754
MALMAWCSARISGGRLEIFDESAELRLVPPEASCHLTVRHTQRLRLRHFMERRDQPHLG